MISSFSDLKKYLKKDTSEMKPVKIAVLADSASQFFCQALKAYGHSQNINFDIWEAEYNQVYQTVIEKEGELYAHKPQFVIIFQSTKKIIGSFYSCSIDDKRSFADNHIKFVEHIAGVISETINTNIIYLNFPEVNDSVFGNFGNKTDVSFIYQVRKINMELMNYARHTSNFHICDIAALQFQNGAKNLFSDQLYVNADNIFNLDALVLVAKSITDIILSYIGKFKKCIVLDLDNTLWGGIIGDDGIENIQIGDLGIGKAFTDFQKWLKQLKERGIILAVSSKNTEHIALEPFEKHPDMVLRKDDISVFAINWDNKVDNIRYIQSVLNIGFDSMVFFDDNPFEREMVSTHIPEITVPDLPEDPAEYLTYLHTLNLFETASFTKDDLKRTKQYQEEAQRNVFQTSFVNEEEFLQSLEMKAVAAQIDKFTLPRSAQLTQRSNQFNLRTVRYTEAELKEIISDSNKFTLTVSLKDKFGDYGLISLVIGEKKNNELFIDTWIMSCRVLKHGVEELVLNELVKYATDNKIATIVGEYIPTPKNGLVKDHYKKLGFTPDGEYWKLTAGDYKPMQTAITSINRAEADIS